MIARSDEINNASHRDLMIGIANTAAAIERRLSMGDELALPDLRSKLD